MLSLLTCCSEEDYTPEEPWGDSPNKETALFWIRWEEYGGEEYKFNVNEATV